ncbi:MAG: DUF4214 domain-containing protein [Desulfobacterales bacterium]|nr:MAG: DUF4214 domain-containing protein [Desulfobacterales bacterium]
MKMRIGLLTIALLGLAGGLSHADQTDTLITKYYFDILDRHPEPPGLEGWKAEIDRMVSLDVNVKEGFIALAKFFLNSEEYQLQRKTDRQYVADLYQTFFNRVPEQVAWDYWVALLNNGLSRNVVLNYFIYGDEFKLYMAGLWNEDSSLPECNLVNDFYRGFQGRLPDSAGFNGWVALMQEAMLEGDQAVRDLCYQIALGFFRVRNIPCKTKPTVIFWKTFTTVFCGVAPSRPNLRAGLISCMEVCHGRPCCKALRTHKNFNSEFRRLLTQSI